MIYSLVKGILFFVQYTDFQKFIYDNRVKNQIMRLTNLIKQL